MRFTRGVALYAGRCAVTLIFDTDIWLECAVLDNLHNRCRCMCKRACKQNFFWWTMQQLDSLLDTYNFFLIYCRYMWYERITSLLFENGSTTMNLAFWLVAGGCELFSLCFAYPLFCVRESLMIIIRISLLTITN